MSRFWSSFRKAERNICDECWIEAKGECLVIFDAGRWRGNFRSLRTFSEITLRENVRREGNRNAFHCRVHETAGEINATFNISCGNFSSHLWCYKNWMLKIFVFWFFNFICSDCRLRSKHDLISNLRKSTEKASVIVQTFSDFFFCVLPDRRRAETCRFRSPDTRSKCPADKPCVENAGVAERTSTPSFAVETADAGATQLQIERPLSEVGRRSLHRQSHHPVALEIRSKNHC